MFAGHFFESVEMSSPQVTKMCLESKDGGDIPGEGRHESLLLFHSVNIFGNLFFEKCVYYYSYHCSIGDKEISIIFMSRGYE